MKHRCLNKHYLQYSNYGGRGIKISKDWLDFNFFVRDMAVNYKPGLTMERINNDGDYCKKNCKWATRKEQANNTRRSRLIEFQGVIKTMAQWIEYFKLKSSTVRQRFYVYHWTIERCFERN